MASKKADDVLDLDEATDDGVEVPLFKLDGIVYSVRKDIPVDVMLDYMENSADDSYKGNPVEDLMKGVLGEEAYSKIRNNPKVTIRKFKDLMERVQERVFEDFSGK